MNRLHKEVIAWWFFALIAWGLVLWSSCGCAELGPPPRLCTTVCGLRLVNTIPPPSDFSFGPGWSCAEFQRAENAALKAFEIVADNRFRNACKAIHDYNVTIKPDVSWISAQNGPVSGETHCIYYTLDVNNLPPMQSTLTHELAHVVQQCDSRGPEDFKNTNDDPAHSNWGSDRIWDAISVVQNEGDKDYNRCIHADAGTPGCDR